MKNKELAKNEPTMSERFMLKVVNEFGSGVGEIALTQSQRRLAQNYFMSLDAILKTAEEKRLKKSEQYRAKTPITWQYVNMPALARSVVSAARIGWDPLERNHVNMIPYLNGTTNLYDIGFIPGYRGLELKALKYGLEIPSSITIELVFSNDVFKVNKKGINNFVESYDLDTPNPFDRGELLGGFYYHEFPNKSKNKLVVMSLKDILKRKPKHASPEFWGGEKDTWEKGKKTGKEQVEGWFEEMCEKTIKRAAYNDITIDSQKIDDAYQMLQQGEAAVYHASAAVEIEADYQQNANKQVIDVTPEPVPPGVDEATGELSVPQDSAYQPTSAEVDAALAAEEEAPY